MCNWFVLFFSLPHVHSSHFSDMRKLYKPRKEGDMFMLPEKAQDSSIEKSDAKGNIVNAYHKCFICVYVCVNVCIESISTGI